MRDPRRDRMRAPPSLRWAVSCVCAVCVCVSTLIRRFLFLPPPRWRTERCSTRSTRCSAPPIAPPLPWQHNCLLCLRVWFLASHSPSLSPPQPPLLLAPHDAPIDARRAQPGAQSTLNATRHQCEIYHALLCAPSRHPARGGSFSLSMRVASRGLPSPPPRHHSAARMFLSLAGHCHAVCHSLTCPCSCR